MALFTRLCNPRGEERDVDSTQLRNVPLLNSILKPVPEDKTFPLFSSLPKELRLQIWEEATPRERVVHVTVAPGCPSNDRPEEEVPVRYLEKNHLGNPISGSRYVLLADNAVLDHALLAVNSEARQVVLDFYRIEMPALCNPSTPHILHSRRRCPGPRVLRINPEHDVLKIRAEAPVKQSLIDFLWDLKAYDPKGVGLLKLALDLRDFCYNDLQYLKRSDLLLIRQRKALVETLSQLREVWFMSMMEPGKEVYKASAESPEGVIPFRVTMSGFQSVGLDTREGAEAALKRVYMGSIDPRELIWRWKRLLRTWEIRHPPGQVKYRVLLARPQVSWDERRNAGRLCRIMDRLTLRDPYGRDRDEKDPTRFRPSGCEAGGSSLPDQAVPGAKNMAAVGFWSFPIEAVGEIGEGKRLNDLDFEPNRFLDLRNYWPELLLAKMV